MSNVRYAKLMPEVDGIQKVRSIGSTDESSFNIMCETEDAISLPHDFDVVVEEGKYLAYRASDNTIVLMDKPVDPEAEAAKALLAAKASCKRAILSVASLEAQTNVNTAIAFGELTDADMALAASFRTWVQAMRQAVSDNTDFPDVPDGVRELYGRF